MTATITTTPACIATGCPDIGVYAACLASYNNGRLHGAWIDLEECSGLEELRHAIAWVLTTSPTPGAEEWAIHDSAGLPGCLSRTEWPDLSELIHYTEQAASCSDDDELEAYRLVCDDQGEVVDYDAFRDAYCGCWPGGEQYAMELAHETGAMPDSPSWPVTCIDWGQAWCELTYDGYREERCSSGGVHILRSY